MIRRRKEKREPSEEEKDLVIRVRHASRELDEVLQGARRKAQKSLETFAKTQVSMLRYAADVYADMLEKLNLNSRVEVDRKLAQLSRNDEVQDAEDDLQETEGMWQNFLDNLERDVRSLNLSAVQEEEEAAKSSESNGKSDAQVDPSAAAAVASNSSKEPSFEVGDKLPGWAAAMLDSKAGHKRSLAELAKDVRMLLVIAQPAYLPSGAVRLYLDLLNKMQADLTEFGLSIVVVTWGPRELCRRWARELHSECALLVDKDERLVKKCAFHTGFTRLWSSNSMCYLGEVKRADVHIAPAPLEVRWDAADLSLGGQILVEGCVGGTPGQVVQLLRSTHLGEQISSHDVRAAALSAYASAHNLSVNEVEEQRATARRLSTAPDAQRLHLEATTGMYYDPLTQLYYDARSQYYYEAKKGEYLYWDAEKGRYVSASHLYAQGPDYYQAQELLRQQMAANEAVIAAAAQATYLRLSAAAAAAAAVGSTDQEEDPDSDIKAPGT